MLKINILMLQWLQIMKQVAETGFRVSISRNTQILIGPVPGHTAVADPAWATEGGQRVHRGRLSKQTSSNFGGSVILWSALGIQILLGSEF